MVDTRETAESQYLTAQVAVEGNIKHARILDEADYVDTDYGRRLQVNVEVDGGRKKVWRINRDSATNMHRTWGTDSKDWIGRVVSLRVIKVAGRDTLVAVPEATDFEDVT